MTYEWEKKRQKFRREARRWLLASLRKHLLPAFIDRGFLVSPLVHGGPVVVQPLDREYLLQQPLGRLLRRREDTVDHITIELAPHSRPAFRLSAGVAPKKGVATFTGRLAPEDVDVSWLDVWFQMTPGARVATYFSVRYWPWQAPVAADYDSLVLRVVGFLPELEAALREDRAGPHTRRIALPSLVFEGEGSMDDVRGTCPTLSFRVNGHAIVTHSGTFFSPTCPELGEGDTVKVYGVIPRKEPVRATLVQKS